MGSGKTAVGELLEKQLELPFLDLDQEISRSDNKSIPEIFEDSGEIYFRRKEAEILKQLLASKEASSWLLEVALPATERTCSC